MSMDWRGKSGSAAELRLLVSTYAAIALEQ